MIKHNKMIKGMKLQLDSCELISDFYVLDVVGDDVIIGAIWVKTLGTFYN